MGLVGWVCESARELRSLASGQLMDGGERPIREVENRGIGKLQHHVRWEGWCGGSCEDLEGEVFIEDKRQRRGMLGRNCQRQSRSGRPRWTFKRKAVTQRRRLQNEYKERTRQCAW